MGYGYWRINRAYVLAPAQAYVGKYLESFKDFPPRQKPGSFNLGDAMAKMTEGTPNN
jgi:arylsulfatase